MSANHDGYENAMLDVFSILDSFRLLGGDSLEAIRIALQTLRDNNLKCARRKTS
jgi:hypothetical protein